MCSWISVSLLVWSGLIEKTCFGWRWFVWHDVESTQFLLVVFCRVCFVSVGFCSCFWLIFVWECWRIQLRLDGFCWFFGSGIWTWTNPKSRNTSTFGCHFAAPQSLQNTMFLEVFWRQPIANANVKRRWQLGSVKPVHGSVEPAQSPASSFWEVCTITMDLLDGRSRPIRTWRSDFWTTSANQTPLHK